MFCMFYIKTSDCLNHANTNLKVKTVTVFVFWTKNEAKIDKVTRENEIWYGMLGEKDASIELTPVFITIASEKRFYKTLQDR